MRKHAIQNDREFKKMIRNNAKLLGKKYTAQYRIFYKTGDPKGIPGEVEYHKTVKIGNMLFNVGHDKHSRKYMLVEM